VIRFDLLEDTTMPRRTIGLLLTLALGLLVALRSSEAEGPAKVRRIGVLMSASAPDPERLRNLEAFRHSLRDMGWVEGQNLATEIRWAEGGPERLPDLAADLVRLPVEVVVAGGGVAVVRAAQHATSTIPIVMVALSGDPVALGLVASLARPGGNLTGTSSTHPELFGKLLQLLQQAVPTLSRIAVLANPAHAPTAAFVRETQVAGQALGVPLHILEVRRRDEVERAFTAMRGARADALLVLTDPLLLQYYLSDITALALQSQLPAIYPWRMYVEAGGLMSYAPSLRELWRRTAYYVDRLLKGTNPADLPVEQPTQFELVINLKTAEALGLTIPPTLLFQADEVIR
jgi:putative tryptophan/tyrosine transport system substrate-binding protein